ncbi:hypothetical protein ILYODFUR_005330 [Ilyodon furcidens]|uniref:Uncharacterized protein n=1 Tax=Ilyodon furcidens TaxID=33524 RepID=A0ABV0TS50_9TELE
MHRQFQSPKPHYPPSMCVCAHLQRSREAWWLTDKGVGFILMAFCAGNGLLPGLRLNCHHMPHVHIYSCTGKACILLQSAGSTPPPTNDYAKLLHRKETNTSIKGHNGMSPITLYI